MQDAHFDHWPAGVPKTLPELPASPYSSLRDIAARYPARVAINYYGAEITYDRLRHEVEALARHLTAIFHGDEGAAQGEAHFTQIFQKQENPDEMPERVVAEPIGLLHLIADADFARGTGAARRLVQQGAVRLDDVRIDDATLTIEPSDEARVLRVGKRNFLRLMPVGGG